MKYFILIILFFLLGGCNSDSHKKEKVSADTTKGNSHGMMDKMQKIMDGMMDDSTMQWMMSDSSMMMNMSSSNMKDMREIHSLLVNYNKIERRVEERKDGIESWTESDDPDVALIIKNHVKSMKARMEEKEPIRQMDPLFRELFEHSEKINMRIEETEKGVHIIETSDDPQVVILIKQHANKAVSEFVKYGMQRAMQPTPLPEGYEK